LIRPHLSQDPREGGLKSKCREALHFPALSCSPRYSALSILSPARLPVSPLAHRGDGRTARRSLTSFAPILHGPRDHRSGANTSDLEVSHQAAAAAQHVPRRKPPSTSEGQ